MGKDRDSAEKANRSVRRKTRRKFSADEKMRIVMEGLRGEETIAELCRREGIAQSLYYTWSKQFLEAGTSRLAGDTKHQASSGEADDLRRENEQLKQAMAELLLQNRVLKKRVPGSERERDD